MPRIATSANVAQKAPAFIGGPAPTAPRAEQRAKRLAAAIAAGQQAGQNITGGWGELGSRLLAQAILSRREDQAEQKAEAARAADQQAQREYIAKQIAGAFPDDARAQAIGAMDPTALFAAAAKGYEPQTLSGGQTLLQGGQAVFQAPVVEKFDDRFGRYDPASNSVAYSDPRGPTFEETEGQRHNQVGEAQGWRGLEIGQQNANSQATSAAASMYGAQTGRMAHDARVRFGGYGTPGAGVVMPTLPGDPGDWKIIPSGGR